MPQVLTPLPDCTRAINARFVAVREKIDALIRLSLESQGEGSAQIRRLAVELRGEVDRLDDAVASEVIP